MKVSSKFKKTLSLVLSALMVVGVINFSPLYALANETSDPSSNVAIEDSTATLESEDFLGEFEVNGEIVTKEEAEEENEIISTADGSGKYIFKNINKQYMSRSGHSYKDLQEVAYLHVKNTYIDESVIEETGGTLNGYFEDFAENMDLEGYVTTTEIDIPLYTLGNQNDKYVVGILNTDEQSEIKDVSFAKYNYNGETLSNEVYDSKTGLVYIYALDLIEETTGEDGETVLLVDNVQCQLLRTYKGSTTVTVTVNNEKTGDESETEYKEDVVYPEIIVPLEENNEKTTALDLDKGDIEVSLNGSQSILAEEDYEIKDGFVVLNTNASNVSSVDVTIKEDAGESDKSVVSVFAPQEVEALTIDPITTFGTYTSYAQVGDTYKFTCTADMNKGTNGWGQVQTLVGNDSWQDEMTNFFKDLWQFHFGDSEYTTNCRISRNRLGSETYAVYGLELWNQGEISSDDLKKCSKINDDERGYETQNQYLEKFIKNINCNMELSCIDINTSYKCLLERMPYVAKITAVGSGYIALTICSYNRTDSSRDYSQALCGTYCIKYEPTNYAVEFVDVGGGLAAGYQGGCCAKRAAYNTPYKADYWEGETVYIAADIRGGYTFLSWNFDGQITYDTPLSYTNPETKEVQTQDSTNNYFVMPDHDVKIYVYTKLEEGNIGFDSLSALPIVSAPSMQKVSKSEFSFMGSDGNPLKTTLQANLEMVDTTDYIFNILLDASEYNGTELQSLFEGKDAYIVYSKEFNEWYDSNETLLKAFYVSAFKSTIIDKCEPTATSPEIYKANDYDNLSQITSGKFLYCFRQSTVDASAEGGCATIKSTRNSWPFPGKICWMTCYNDQACEIVLDGNGATNDSGKKWEQKTELESTPALLTEIRLPKVDYGKEPEKDGYALVGWSLRNDAKSGDSDVVSYGDIIKETGKTFSFSKTTVSNEVSDGTITQKLTIKYYAVYEELSDTVYSEYQNQNTYESGKYSDSALKNFVNQNELNYCYYPVCGFFLKGTDVQIMDANGNFVESATNNDKTYVENYALALDEDIELERKYVDIDKSYVINIDLNGGSLSNGVNPSPVYFNWKKDTYYNNIIKPISYTTEKTDEYGEIVKDDNGNVILICVKFDKWIITEGNDKGKEFRVGSNPGGNITIQAQWEEVEKNNLATINYVYVDSDGNQVPMYSEFVEKGSCAIVNKNSVDFLYYLKTGKDINDNREFVGYSTNPDGGYRLWKEGSVIKVDNQDVVTLYTLYVDLYPQVLKVETEYMYEDEHDGETYGKKYSLVFVNSAVPFEKGDYYDKSDLYERNFTGESSGSGKVVDIYSIYELPSTCWDSDGRFIEPTFCEDSNSTESYGHYIWNYNSTDIEWINKKNKDSIENVIIDESFSLYRPTSTAYWFYELHHVRNFEGLEYIDTSKVVNMRFMFYKCSDQILGINIDLSGFNTSNVVDMSYMFGSFGRAASETEECASSGLGFGINGLTFDTSKVKDMSGMFNRAGQWQGNFSLDLSSFDTTNCKNMDYVFVRGKNHKSENEYDVYSDYANRNITELTLGKKFVFSTICFGSDNEESSALGKMPYSNYGNGRNWLLLKDGEYVSYDKDDVTNDTSGEIRGKFISKNSYVLCAAVSKTVNSCELYIFARQGTDLFNAGFKYMSYSLGETRTTTTKAINLINEDGSLVDFLRELGVSRKDVTSIEINSNVCRYQGYIKNCNGLFSDYEKLKSVYGIDNLFSVVSGNADVKNMFEDAGSSLGENKLQLDFSDVASIKNRKNMSLIFGDEISSNINVVISGRSIDLLSAHCNAILKENTSLNNDLKIGTTSTLNLNGNTLWGDGKIIIEANGDFTVFSDGEVTISKYTESASDVEPYVYGGCFEVLDSGKLKINCAVRACYQNEKILSGGAVYVRNGGTLELGENAKFTSCYATNYGGAIYLQKEATLKIFVTEENKTGITKENKGTYFKKCTAGKKGNEIYLQGGGDWFERQIANEAELKDAINNSDESKYILANNIEVSSSCIVSKDFNLDLGGHTIGASGSGYRLFKVNKSAELTLSNGTITNFDTNGAASDTAGSAICVTSGKVTLNSCTIKNCKSGTSGGAIYVNNNATLNIDKDSSFNGCTAANCGGAIYLEKSAYLNYPWSDFKDVDVETFASEKFANCTAKTEKNGYQIYQQGIGDLVSRYFDSLKTVEINSVEGLLNAAKSNRSCTYKLTQDLEDVKTQVTVEGSLYLDLNGCTISAGKDSTKRLFEVSGSSAVLSIVDSSKEKTGVISGFKADGKYGGAIYVHDGGSLILGSIKISNCKATDNGGAMYVGKNCSFNVFDGNTKIALDGCSSGGKNGGGAFFANTCSTPENFVNYFTCTNCTSNGENKNIVYKAAK